MPTEQEKRWIEASLWETAVDLHNYLESCNHSFCVIGGTAQQRWGEPRVTQDVDVTLIDIDNITIRRGKKLDREIILNELKPLIDLKEEPEILEHL